MKLIDVLQTIEKLNISIFTTRDIAARLKIPLAHTSNLLLRLTKSGALIHLSRALWGRPRQINPMQLPRFLTAPLPSYISLQSSLSYHGMISQIPEVIYAVSLARTRRYKTPIGLVSIHHIQPDMFFGYELLGDSDIMMAIPEKALIDFLYFYSAKSKLFRRLPELELIDTFDIQLTNSIIAKIPSNKRRTMVHRLFDQLISEDRC